MPPRIYSRKRKYAFSCGVFLIYMIKSSYGAVAEWLRRGLQNLVHRFNSGRRLQKYKPARMAELVYAFDLKSNGEIHMGSSPISGTTLNYEKQKTL